MPFHPVYPLLYTSLSLILNLWQFRIPNIRTEQRVGWTNYLHTALFQSVLPFNTLSVPILTFTKTPDILDGGMVTLAIYTLNFAHPGLLLFRRFPKESSTPRSSSNDTTGASTPKMEPNSMQV